VPYCVRIPPHRNCDAGGRNATRESNQEWPKARSRCLAVPLGGQRAFREAHLSKESDRHSLPIRRRGVCSQSSRGIADRNQHESSPATHSADDDHGSVRSLYSARIDQRQSLAQLFHKESLQGIHKKMDRPALGQHSSF
jgi:hypothetical protein